MDTLMSRVRKALEEWKKVVILNESAPRFRNPRDYMEKYIRDGVVNYDHNHDLYPPSFYGSFEVALNPGIYYIGWDGKINSETNRYIDTDGKELGIKAFKQMVRFSDKLVQQIDTTLEPKTSRYGWRTDSFQIWAYPDHLPSQEDRKGSYLQVPKMIGNWKLGTIERREREPLYGIRINPLFKDMFPELDYETKVTLPKDYHGVDFCLYIYVWPNRELYQIGQETRKRYKLRPGQVKKLKKPLEDLFPSISDAEQILRRDSLELGGCINIPAFNQYFQEHPPKKGGKR